MTFQTEALTKHTPKVRVFPENEQEAETLKQLGEMLNPQGQGVYMTQAIGSWYLVIYLAPNSKS